MSRKMSGAKQTARDLEEAYFEDHTFRNHTVNSLAWRNMTIAVGDSEQASGKTILNDVSGIAMQGEMVAIMGPSGSGKSTLLNHLGHRSTAGTTSSGVGNVMINGQVTSLSAMRIVSSFVEQEDALIGSLTAEETLRFAGSLAIPGLNKQRLHCRAADLIEAFGLTNVRDRRVGTPIQKGLSGGQKRRVSVASQLITAPKILLLDEPTSGLDSTASFEVMSYLKNIARQFNIIVIASIHQPSTKIFNLFDRVGLLSAGRMCYYGHTCHLSPYLNDVGLPVPPMTNPAEYILDIVNTDFKNVALQGIPAVNQILQSWKKSELKLELEHEIASEPAIGLLIQSNERAKFVAFLHTIVTLIHRGFLKSVRDVVAYWIRIVMYTGLAIMMGTVWLRLDTTQASIQPFINAIFFGSAFMSFMAVAYVPAFLEDRTAYIKERANGLYGPFAFNLANFLVGLPYLFIIVILFSLIAYFLINLTPTPAAFLRWIMWLYLDLLAAESMVIFIASLFPNFIVALALIAFANGLWMCVGGFLVSPTLLNPFWRYVFHYIDYQAYVFQGMMVNEFAGRVYECAAGCHCTYQSELASECRIAGTAVLESFGYAAVSPGKCVGILLGITAVYRMFAWAALYVRKV